MLIKDKKIKTFANQFKFEFNLLGKIAGSKYENTTVVTKNGVEITQEEYEILKVNDSTKLSGDYLFTINLKEICKLYFDDDMSIMLSKLVSKEGNGSIYNFYRKTYSSSFYTSDVNYYFNRDFEVIFKITNPNYFNIKLGFTKTATVLSSVKENLAENKSMLLQGLTLGFDPSENVERSILNIPGESSQTQITFESKSLPTGFTALDRGVKYQVGPSISDTVLAFANTGVKSSTGTLRFSGNFQAPTDVVVEFYVSSESNYDWFLINLNNVTQLKISGTSSKKVSTNIGSQNVNTQAWSTYTIKGVNGAFQIDFKYTKDSSGNSGSDNAFIRSIKYGSDNMTTLSYVNNRLLLKSGGATLIQSEPLGNVKGDTLDVLVGFNDITSLAVLSKENTQLLFSDNKLDILGQKELTLLGKGASLDFLLDAFYVINKEILATEIEDILKGVNPLFKRPNILDGAILQNTSYKLQGSALLLVNENISRVVNGDFETTSNENRIELQRNSVCVRK